MAASVQAALAGAPGLAVGNVGILGLSEAVIGLTVVAIGTSAPELVTSIIAARKGQGAVAFGNVAGSNLFNRLGILGVTALMAWMARSGWTLSRREGALLSLLYAGYLGWLLLLDT